MALPPTYVPQFHDKNAVEKMKYNDFGTTGLKISEISLGTGGFCSVYGDYRIEQCKQVVVKALKHGVNYIDTAPWYGRGVSEETLAKCLEDVPRQAYYIATKIGRYEKDPKAMFDFSAARTKKSIDESLQRLKLDYVDVLQIHDIEFAPSVDYLIKETLPALLDIVKEGKAKFIGVTGYPVGLLAEFVQKSPVRLDMVLSYSRLTLFDDSLFNYIDIFKGLGVVNAAGLAMGLLTNQGPQPWHPAHQDIKDICTTARTYCQDKGIELARLATYHLYEQCRNQPTKIHTQLVGMRTVKEFDENYDVCLNGISDAEKDALVYLKNSVFSKLQNHHWEDVELKAFGFK